MITGSSAFADDDTANVAPLNTQLFSAFLLISAVLFITPGPIVTLIIATGARQGTRAAIREDLVIDLPHPRDQIKTRGDERFTAYRQRLFSSIFLQEKSGAAQPLELSRT